MTQRESGFYWVRGRRWVDFSMRWQVAEWRAAGEWACWIVLGYNSTVRDTDLFEIDEHRITRPSETEETRG